MTVTADSIMTELEALDAFSGPALPVVIATLKRTQEHGPELFTGCPVQSIAYPLRAGFGIRREVKEQLHWKLKRTGLVYDLKESRYLTYPNLYLAIQVRGWGDLKPLIRVLKHLHLMVEAVNS